MDKPTRAAMILGVTVKDLFKIASERHKHRNKYIKWRKVYKKYNRTGILMIFVSEFCDRVINHHRQKTGNIMPIV
jgi:hypothetical protein